MSFEQTITPTNEPHASQSEAPATRRAPGPVFHQTVVRGLDEKPAAPQGKKSMNRSSSRKALIIGIFVAILAGLGTGAVAARFLPGGPSLAEKMAEVERTEEITDNQIKAGAIFGVPDEKTFKDPTSGVLVKGGVDGEGSHTLLRPGDASQNVYLTSSVVDLDQFVDMEIKVWGETFKGQKAGWLMDVGRVEVLNTTGTKPTWYKEPAGAAGSEE